MPAQIEINSRPTRQPRIPEQPTAQPRHRIQIQLRAIIRRTNCPKELVGLEMRRTPCTCKMNRILPTSPQTPRAPPPETKHLYRCRRRLPTPTLSGILRKTCGATLPKLIG